MAKEYWKHIPSSVDVLITHGPPFGILDKATNGKHVGDEDLLIEVASRCKPQFHIFGHIHEAYGVTQLGKTTYINAATSNLFGQPQNAPIVFDMRKKIT